MVYLFVDYKINDKMWFLEPISVHVISFDLRLVCVFNLISCRWSWFVCL